MKQGFVYVTRYSSTLLYPHSLLPVMMSLIFSTPNTRPYSLYQPKLVSQQISPDGIFCRQKGEQNRNLLHWQISDCSYINIACELKTKTHQDLGLNTICKFGQVFWG